MGIKERGDAIQGPSHKIKSLYFNQFSHSVVSGFYGYLFLVLGHWAQGEQQKCHKSLVMSDGSLGEAKWDIPVWCPCTAGVGFRAAPCPCTAPCTAHSWGALQHGHWVENCPQLHSPLHACPQLPTQSPQLHPEPQHPPGSPWGCAGMEGGCLFPHLTPAASAPLSSPAPPSSPWPGQHRETHPTGAEGSGAQEERCWPSLSVSVSPSSLWEGSPCWDILGSKNAAQSIPQPPLGPLPVPQLHPAPCPCWAEGQEVTTPSAAWNSFCKEMYKIALK